jgi:D-3-phosphoglycerate dehydrogenase
MGDPVVEALVLDLLEWLAAGERSYEEVMEAWRTSCPKLPVWEEANDRGLITSQRMNGRKLIMPSASGLLLLKKSRQGSRPEAARTA